MTRNASTNHAQTRRSGTRVAGVVGWPVAHSLSPTLHGAWIAALGLDAVYKAFAVPPEDALRALRSLPASGLAGVNVTVPHKATALAAADRATKRAERIGVANLLTVTHDGLIRADNTDALGFLDGLIRAGVDALGPAVVLGAGGAARAVAVALAEAGCREICFLNRSVEKARDLAALAKSCGIETTFARPWSDAARALKGARLLVNATSLGMHGAAPLDVPDLSVLAPDAAVYDLVYAPRETELLKAAKALGLKAIEGLDMLIGQARPSFEAFFGVAPPESVDARTLLASAKPANPPSAWPVALS
jgi:shikimate dehydrogenase